VKASRRLCILDNSFPDQHSAFRYSEFKAYLETLPEAVAVCVPGQITYWMKSKPLDQLIKRFCNENPDTKGRVISYESFKDTSNQYQLLYFVFLANVSIFRADLRRGKPFVFTLYPGGGFVPYSDEANLLLKEVFAYPGFRHVIVTQPFVRDYLVRGKFCSEEKITLIPGVVVPSEFLAPTLIKPPQRNENEPLNICFVAYRYSEGGREKGFDIFLDVVRRLLATTNYAMRFHLVGGWEADVFDEELKPHLIFHDVMETRQLLEFLSKMDILVSPNRSGEPVRGRFDGFPTTAALQAGLAGAAVFATDCLWQNNYFKDGEEIVIINHSPSEIGDRITSYISDRARLENLRSAGTSAFRRLYDFEAQMAPRIELLKKLLKSEEN
jgi:glycosyltransferase involved in cell wall biosynthesis